MAAAKAGSGALTLRAGPNLCAPSGATKIRLEKQHGGTAWRLVGSRADGMLCHKPCTVSGGGKSEISKSIASIILQGPGVCQRLPPRHGPGGGDPGEGFFRSIYKQPDERASRPILSPERSLGSVIKLLTPSPEYTDEHNEWLRELAADYPAACCSP